jgi:hypothetical protein
MASLARAVVPAVSSLAAGLLVACVRAPQPWPGATPETWPALRSELAVQRAHRPRSTWTAAVATELREPRTGQTIRGRGGLAVSPGRGARLILSGVAGFTMLDAWVTPARWRIAVPPMNMVRRGGADEPPDLPVAFLRGWFFRPLEGTLFAAARFPEGPTWLLRDQAAVVRVDGRTCERGPRLLVTRREAQREESIDECRARQEPSTGDRVHYEDLATGLAVDIRLEAVGVEPPPAQAFDDPDLPQPDDGVGP